MSEWIQGQLVSGEDLKKVARERRRPNEVIRVPWGEVENAKRQGYSIDEEFGYGARMVKPKSVGRLFEDRVWLLLWRFGFTELNGPGRLFFNVGRGKARPSRVEVDVFGRADDNVFIVECKASDRSSRMSMESIAKVKQFSPRIQAAVRKHYDDRDIKVSFIMATRNLKWSQAAENEAESGRVYKIHTWRDEQLDHLAELAKLHNVIGESARYQLYAIMFGKQKIRALEDKRVAAIKGRIGKVVYYSFLAKPEDLLKISYVHRRAAGLSPEGLRRVREAYQRMLKPTKLREIDEFISRGEFFPNSIIVNFSRPPRFDVKASEDLDFQYGMLTLPNSYGSAWIIDGQHRLYGYAKNPYRATAPIPVVAFDGLKPSMQAKMFVDINQKQTKVEPNLLWDLAGDIYEDSEDPDQIERFVISHVARHLDSLSNSPLKGHIFIPSVGKRSATRNVTMTTVCGSIKRNKLLGPEMFWPVRDRPGFTQFVAQRIVAFLRGVQSLYPEDWVRGDDGYLRSNNGIAALFILMRQVLKYLNVRDQQALYRKLDTADFQNEVTALLLPAIKYLSEQELSDEFRQRRGVAGQTDSAQELCRQIRAYFIDFPLPKLEEELPDEVEKTPPTPENLDQLIVDTEIVLQDIVLGKLVEKYGDEWYNRGVPEHIKGIIKERLEAESRRRPWIREEVERDPAKKLQYTDLGQLKDIIVCRANWIQFEDIFVSKQQLETNFGDYIHLRNSYRAHPREPDEVVVGKGLWAIRWIRKCLKL